MNLATEVVSIRRKNLFLFLFSPIVILSALGIFRFFYIHHFDAEPFGEVKWADIGAEGSLVMWWTSAMWNFAALLCLLESARNVTRMRYYWLAIGIGSMLLSVDESVKIHEHFSAPAGNFFGNPGGVFAASWVLAAIPIVFICLLILLPFLAALPRKTAVRLFIAGAVFVSGAVGTEMAFAYVATSTPDALPLIWTLVCIEETLEMIGVALFCLALYDHMRIAGHLTRPIER